MFLLGQDDELAAARQYKRICSMTVALVKLLDRITSRSLDPHERAEISKRYKRFGQQDRRSFVSAA